MFKKPIIVFEGIEASGKSTKLNIVSNYLRKKKIPFVKFREPGGSKNSEKIRKLILNKKADFNNITDLFLYFASRSENIDKIIKKNKINKFILIDRFIDSTVAYQHYGMRININLINSINKFLLNKIKPDFTFINVVNKKNMIKRLKIRKNLNRYDLFPLSFYARVQKGFLSLAQNNKKYMIINSNLHINQNKNQIINKLKKII